MSICWVGWRDQSFAVSMEWCLLGSIRIGTLEFGPRTGLLGIPHFCNQRLFSWCASNRQGGLLLVLSCVCGWLRGTWRSLCTYRWSLCSRSGLLWTASCFLDCPCSARLLKRNWDSKQTWNQLTSWLDAPSTLTWNPWPWKVPPAASKSCRLCRTCWWTHSYWCRIENRRCSSISPLLNEFDLSSHLRVRRFSRGSRVQSWHLLNYVSIL